ncbi:DUF4148 domain-containing protein [Achromobacter deleyi]|uniref:DUF4148 domain-containing protein n=1 Tax=Achromobacter deleyi TaxID=1353891 RepID=UPI00149210E5|nr:DUF4148 domain-containing protein [Achromobacter deleyi]QVQ24405.1 DUF4148 domain-containing protein [Achromobacter deleyi]UIP19937.1 DUF4148 domain-containing protein [Achromobacter deleyi]
MKPVLPFRALIPVALAAFALLSSPASAQPAAASAPTTAAPSPNVTLTRADVERDLAAWKDSGVERQWSGDESPDINSPEYVADYRKYVSTVRPGDMSQPASQSQSPSGSQRRW